MNKTKRLTYMALMVSYSLVLHFIESTLPSLYFIAPGAKLGLSNIISLVLLYMNGAPIAIGVLLTRIVLGAIFGGNISSFIYSLSGGLFAIFSMWGIKAMDMKSISVIGVSVVGSVFFNIGQLFAAGIMIENFLIFAYLPVTIYVSIGTGLLVGYSAKFVLQRLMKN